MASAAKKKNTCAPLAASQTLAATKPPIHPGREIGALKKLPKAANAFFRNRYRKFIFTPEMDRKIRKFSRDDPAFLMRLIDKVFPSPQAVKSEDGAGVRINVVLPGLNIAYAPKVPGGAINVTDGARLITADKARAEQLEEFDADGEVIETTAEE